MTEQEKIEELEKQVQDASLQSINSGADILWKCSTKNLPFWRASKLIDLIPVWKEALKFGIFENFGILKFGWKK